MHFSARLVASELHRHEFRALVEKAGFEEPTVAKSLDYLP